MKYISSKRNLRISLREKLILRKKKPKVRKVRRRKRLY
jgi:hypothetical protein